jgi:hypothetical protein
MGIAVKQGFGRHDLPVLAETTLGRLLVNPCLLQRVQLAALGQAFERCDLAFYGGSRCDARTYRGPIDNDRAGSALAESASETRTLQAEIVTQNIRLVRKIRG